MTDIIKLIATTDLLDLEQLGLNMDDSEDLKREISLILGPEGRNEEVGL